ncbi:Biphenyl dioxygenase subunit alpha [Penicillium rolfsii]|nr:Biphenyl dioxygenase subunit alpha [Penicillium rolfsii]
MTELARTLPASWYCNEALYQMERRAVFQKSWYLLGPVTRFQKVGERVDYEIAQEPIYVVRLSGDTLNPLPEELKVFHAKTDKEACSHVTKTGLLFSAISDDAPSFHEFFPELEDLLGKVDFTRLPHRRSIRYEGRFNWKTMVDGYQECLHCQYTHPSFSVYYPPTFYTVRNNHNFSQHIADPKKPDDGLFLYFFPNCTLNVYGGGMSSFRVCPTPDPQVTRMEFDYYHLAEGEKFEEYFKFVRQVAMEDFELCEKAQDNLAKGVYHEGILNPEKENGVSYYQQRVFQMVCEQHATDRASKQKEEAGRKDQKLDDRGIEFMEFLSAYFLSPGSVIVALLTLIFLAHQSWPRLRYQKKACQFSGELSEVNDEDNLNVSKEPEVPEGWWSSREVFELERRGIFSKSWIYLAHASHFSKAGAYQSFDIAELPIFLIRGKDNKIRAFHNVCRHRAYTITRKETGTSTVLGCRYHGWSYDTTGRLVKAPQFDGIPGFDKSENSLFEIHTHTTDHGMVFVNLDAGTPTPFPTKTASELDGFAGAACLGSKSIWIAGQTLTGTFNWKFAMGPQHCTNASTRLDEIVSAAAPPSFASKMIRIITRHNSRADCHMGPTSMLHSFEDAPLWISLSFLPASQSVTQVRYDLFCLQPTTEIKERLASTVAEGMRALIQSIETEFQSVTTSQVENSSWTRDILKQLQEHARLEKKSGAQILPAMRQPRGSSLFQQAEQLCKEIDCSGSGSASSGLDW